jgi:hypothetical protein
MRSDTSCGSRQGGKKRCRGSLGISVVYGWMDGGPSGPFLLYTAVLGILILGGDPFYVNVLYCFGIKY